MTRNEIFPLSHEQLVVISPHKLRDWWMRVRVRLPTRDPVLARAAVRLVHERHDALRLQLVDVEGGRVRQRVRRWGPDLDAELPVLDQADADLLGAPDPHHQVSRCALLVGAEGIEVELRVHHLGWDGWSASVFERDLLAAAAAVRGSGQAPPAAAFRDHVRAQYQAGRGMGAAQRAYWMRALGDVTPWHALPAGSAPASRDHRSAPVVLPAPSALAAAARAVRATPAALVTAALLRSLAERTGVPDRLVYVVHHGRDHPRFFPVVGFFARSVPLRIDAGSRRGLPALARSTMLGVAEGVEQSRPPFALYRLARELGLSGAEKTGSGGANALAEVTINLQAAPPGAAGAPGPAERVPLAGSAVPDRPPARPGRLWLLGILDGAGQLWAEYDARRFPDSQVAAVLSRAADLLAAAARDV